MPKSAPDELYPVLEAFSPFLKSIDMRTIAVKSPDDEEWSNLVTSITISEKTIEDVKRLHQKLPKMRNNYVALFLLATTFDYSPFDFFVQGMINFRRLWVVGGSTAFEGTTIRTRKFDPLKLKVNSSRRWVDRVPRQMLSATHLKSEPERENLWAVLQNQSILIKQSGFESTEDLVKNALNITEIRYDKDLEITICDPAQISNIAFNKNALDIEIEKASGLKNLQLNVVQERATGDGYLHPIFRETIAIDESGKENKIRKAVNPESLLPFDYVRLNLIHRDSGLILDEASVRAPLENVVEPFLKVMKAFCSYVEFREMLLHPEKGSKKPDKRFEIAVSWLLSLSGFHTIYLGLEIRLSKKGNLVSFDVLRNENGIPIGCSDIIAYEDNKRILLVDCDISGLDEKKIQKLAATREHFKNILNFKELKIVPVLFSPRTFGVAPKNNLVVIADENVIEGMLEDIAKGDRESARSRIWL